MNKLYEGCPPPGTGDLTLKFVKVHPDAKLPSYAHHGDAGMDVCSVDDVELTPGCPTLVSTGLVADIPDGYEIQVRPRSGLALKHGITVWNSPGTIDSNYRGTIGVILYLALGRVVRRNVDQTTFEYSVKPNDPYVIHKGDRIAQLVLSPVTRCIPVESEAVSTTDRGASGFGSTGT